MMARKTAYEKIEEGLKEALEIARGNAKPANLFVPPELSVRAIRTKTGLSQEDFAAVFGFTIHQIRQWEQGRSRPLGALRAYLLIIDRDPESVKALLRQAAHAKKVA
jgi:putative transcriptional regulator